MECFFCHKKGHFAWQCPVKKRKGQKKKDSSENCAFMVTSARNSDAAENNAERFGKMKDADVWLLDSGASRHISFRREWFKSFSPCAGEEVVLGDNCSCEVRETGVVEIRKLVDKEWSSSVIENVLFVPTFRKNLFSVGASVKRGLEVNFSENRVLILKQGKVVAEGAK